MGTARPDRGTTDRDTSRKRRLISVAIGVALLGVFAYLRWADVSDDVTMTVGAVVLGALALYLVVAAVGPRRWREADREHQRRSPFARHRLTSEWSDGARRIVYVVGALFCAGLAVLAVTTGSA